MRVPGHMLDQYEPAGQIGVVAGSSGLAIPAMDAANHAVGHLMDGLLYHSRSSIGKYGTGRLMTVRHTNADYVLGWFYVDALFGPPIVPDVTMIAGTGGATVVAVPTAPHSFFMVTPWGAADSGWQQVTWTIKDCTIKGISIWQLPRRDITVAADLAAERADPTYLQGGLGEGQFIISNGSDDRHINGVADTLEEAYDLSLPTAVQASGMDTPGGLVGAGIGVWTQVASIGPYGWYHLAQTWRNGDTSQQYRCYVMARRSAGAGNYTWRFRATGVPSTVTWGPGADAALTWRNVDGLLIDATATDQIYFEAAADVGTTLEVSDLTVKRWTP